MIITTESIEFKKGERAQLLSLEPPIVGYNFAKNVNLLVHEDPLCPFQFGLPPYFKTESKKISDALVVSGESGTSRVNVVCGRGRQPHFSRLLNESNCSIYPASPHRQICDRSKKWPGVETLQITKVGWSTIIQYLAYTIRDEWLFISIMFNMQIPASTIKRTLLDAQSVARSVSIMPVVDGR
ncbi:MAG: hypothetical protein ABL907_01015 [Hyphomicrobium sp.]